MKSPGDLFELVSSLTLSEKRYFKLFATLQVRDGQSNYMRLFEEVDKMVTEGNYEEAELSKRLADESFHNYLPRLKNYLYNSILKSLRNFHEGASLDHQLKDLLKELLILYRKGLYRQAWKILGKARRLAAENERFFVLLEVLNWERKLIETHIDDGSFEECLTQNIESEKEIRRITDNISELRRVSTEIFILNKKVREARSKEHLAKWEALMNHPVFSRFDEMTSFAEKRFWYMLQSNWYHNQKNFQKAYDYRRKLIELFHENKWFIKEEPFIYLFMLNNLINTCTDLRKFEEVELWLDEMRLTPDKYGVALSESLDLYIFSTAYIHELNLYLYTCRFDQANKVLPAVIAGMERYEGKINKEKELVLMSKIMYLTYARGDKAQCRQWVRKLLEEKNDNLRSDLQGSARIMNLILLYENEEYDLLESALRNSARYMKNKEAFLQTEHTFVRYLKKLAKLSGEAERVILADLYHDIQKLARDPMERRAFVYFDYLVWIRSRLNKTTFNKEAKLMLN